MSFMLRQAQHEREDLQCLYNYGPINNNIKEGVVCQEKVAPMITDSNHACFTKMSGCGFQEEINTKFDSLRKVKS